MWPLLGDGVGTEDPRCGDAEPGHRERICKQCHVFFLIFSQSRTPLLSPSVNVWPHFVFGSKVKCAQYWPNREEKDAIFKDTNFKLTHVSEDVKSYYTVRQLELENLSVSFLPRCCWFLFFSFFFPCLHVDVVSD